MIFLTAAAIFAFSGVAFGQHDPNCWAGRHVIVHLFEWKWTDIAAECERYLGPKGFCGVQVSPANEHRVVTDPFRPWWERYQPVGYNLNSRSGNDGEFKDMVSRCNNVGVRIYVDAVINHMAGAGMSGTGSGGSYFDSGSALSFPSVPFGPSDFNCCNCAGCSTSGCNIENYGDVNQVRNCRLVGLTDLALGNEYVRGKVADFLNYCIDIGVAGFRVDASKHMWPGDMQNIAGRLNNLNGAYFNSGARPFIFQEVIDLGGEPIKGTEYTGIGRVTEFNYGGHLGRAFRKQFSLSSLSNFGEGWGMLSSGNAVVFIDNHDNQRGHGAGGADILTFYVDKWYKMANAFMLAHEYGFTRLMSSYSWDGGPSSNDWIGPPSDGSGNTNYVPINEDGTCGDRWMCEHRWRQIGNMVAFRNAVTGQGTNDWWDNGNNQIAFARGNKGFIAINNDDYNMDEWLQTGLPSGDYCDVISGDVTENGCTGTTVSVDGNGFASVFLSSQSTDPVLAIHENSKVGKGSGGDGGVVTDSPVSVTTRGDISKFRRTVFMLKKKTSYGQDMFLRGGLDSEVKQRCPSNGPASSSDCAIPMSHNSLGTSSHYDKINAWRVGDNYLDWHGAESGQGTYNGQTADGTPAAWTSSSSGSSGYQPLNVYGDHYWMIDVQMDCSKAEGGWFEVKGYVTNGEGWEGDIYQDSSCGGTMGGSKPYTSSNHMGRCGYVNVFEWNANWCSVNNF
ncbi:unnamed protein product [Owenia fusiformis]|uniref:alpha-amylase n=1 Tax=Owenia fusiformis TaxID=6347 RepID=A0A8J1TCK6_OWEFU|nr:unnamed protein product [Owenia fusiformis]